MTFKTGDIVRLKSGGPKMTVYRQWDSDQVECNHFIADAMRIVVLPQQMLELIDDPSFGFIRDETFDELPAYDHIGDDGPALSDEELDALMYASEVEQYGPRPR